jgi:hypothetical protein
MNVSLSVLSKALWKLYEILHIVWGRNIVAYYIRFEMKLLGRVHVKETETRKATAVQINLLEHGFNVPLRKDFMSP